MSCAKAAAIGDRLAVGGNEEPSLRLGPSTALGSDEHVGESGEGVDGGCAAKLLANWMGDGKNKLVLSIVGEETPVHILLEWSCHYSDDILQKWTVD